MEDAHSSQLQLWSTPSGSRSKLPLLCRLCWWLALSDRTSEDIVLKREAKQKYSRLLWMWPTVRHKVPWMICFLLACRKEDKRPGGCPRSGIHLAPAAVEQHPSLIFHTSRMFGPSPSLQLLPVWLIYSWAPHVLPTNSLYFALSKALDSSMWVLPLWEEPSLQLFSQTSEISVCDLGYSSVWNREQIVLSC